MYGSKYHYLEIEKLILETDEELVFQWSQVFEWIRDPNGSKRLTFDQIEELLDAKHLQLKNITPKITPPFHHEIADNSTSSQDENPKEIKPNKNSEQPHDYFSNPPVSHNKQADLAKNSNIFTVELKAAFTKVAFQQWKIATQMIKIQETNLKLQQQEALIKINHEIIINTPNIYPTVKILTTKVYPTANPNISVTDSAQVLKSTYPLHTNASTTTNAIFIQKTTPKQSSDKASTSDKKSNEHKNEIVVPAAIAEAHGSMAYAAKLKAQALTNAHWPVANARATVSNTITNQCNSSSYKDILMSNKFNKNSNPFYAPTTVKLPIASTQNQNASSTQLSAVSTTAHAHSTITQGNIQIINKPTTSNAARTDATKITIQAAL
jgi:hypothetical protein